MPRIPTPNRCRNETWGQRQARYRRQRERHAADGFARIKHGSTHGYNMGCRCDPCKARYSTYHKEWRARGNALGT